MPFVSVSDESEVAINNDIGVSEKTRNGHFALVFILIAKNIIISQAKKLKILPKYKSIKTGRFNILPISIPMIWGI